MAQLYMQVQPDWREIADESSADDARCWLDVYQRTVRLADDSEHESNSDSNMLGVRVDAPASAHFELDLSAPQANAAAGTETPQQQHLVEIVKRERQWIEVHAHTMDEQHEPRTVRMVFQSPAATFGAAATSATGHRGPQLYAVDVSQDEKFIAIGGADGHCALWDALDRTEAFVLPGHVSDVTCARFFPSSVVLLTGSLDFTLRIWSVTSGQCAAVLKGHRGGVEDAAILGRGRNILSCSSDGLIHLWSCGTQEVIAKWGNDAQSAVHCLSVLNDAGAALTAQVDTEEPTMPPAHDLEAETDGKVLFGGLENGETLGVDIRMRQLAMNLRGTGPILSCAAAASNGVPMLFTGSEDGMFTTWDLRHANSPLALRSRSAAPIHSIALAETAGATATPRVWTAHGDGVCCSWTDATALGVATQLTGPLYDPIRDVAVAPRTGRVFTVCRDGLARDYNPHVLV